MHGNDGLIYTCASSGYVIGTDRNIMKWKPPSENSIDFKLVLRFPPLRGSHQPDFHAKPYFVLNVWTGGKGSKALYQFFDLMEVTDEEWEEMKRSEQQFDDRIVEVVWIADPSPRWKMLRFRNDKPEGNYIDTVESICKSISEGVEKEDLLQRSAAIKQAWKERAANNSSRPSTGVRPPPQQPPPQRRPPLPVAVYGPLEISPYSRVGGPEKINGMYR